MALSQALNHLLDNIIWQTLTGAHAAFSTGTDKARRYAPGFSPILGFADVGKADLAELVPFCEPGERLYTGGWTGPVAAGWEVVEESSMHVMLWAGAMPERDEAPESIRLGPEHASQALDLAVLTRPGPFGLRTIELGEYFGLFEGSRLVAMAGERMCAAPYREISGVCTHPDFQGRGFARRLTNKLLRRQMQRGEVAFLHVLRDNTGASGLYERMGFRNHQERAVRVVARS